MQEIIITEGNVLVSKEKNQYKTHWELAKSFNLGRRQYGFFVPETPFGSFNGAGLKLGLGLVQGPIIVAEFENRPLTAEVVEYVKNLLK